MCERIEAEAGRNLSPKKHGFRVGKSTATAITSVIRWTGDRTEKHVLGIFLVISGAFDNVKWSLLRRDLEAVGCTLYFQYY